MLQDYLVGHLIGLEGRKREQLAESEMEPFQNNNDQIHGTYRLSNDEIHLFGDFRIEPPNK